MKTEVSHELKSLSKQFTDAFCEKDVNAIRELMHEDFALFDPALKHVQGREKVLQAIKEDCFDKFQNVSYHARNIYCENTTTIIDFEIRLDDIVLRGVDLVQWKDHRMTSLDCYYTEV